MATSIARESSLRKWFVALALGGLLALGGVHAAPAVAEEANNAVVGAAGQVASDDKTVVLSTQVGPTPEPVAIDYISTQWDEANRKVASSTESAQTYTVVTSDMTTWGEAEQETWYYVQEDVDISNARVTCLGTVNLILADGKTLNVPEGITVQSGAELHVYAQSTTSSMGTLIAGTEAAMSAEGHASVAGIGGLQGTDEDTSESDAGAIAIHGGNIQAVGLAAGIGNGARGNGGSVTIYSGTVEAASVGGSAAIGNGGDCGTITICGGTVTATGGTTTFGDESKAGGAGIGTGSGNDNDGLIPEGTSYLGNIAIKGGAQVTAKGGYGAAGIGGGWLAKSNNVDNNRCITIEGANTKVKATGGAGAAGIGSGLDALVYSEPESDAVELCSALIRVYGGTIEATGGSLTEDGATYAGAGIGGGASKNRSVPGAQVEVVDNSSDGSAIKSVTATGGSAGAQGIGRGSYGSEFEEEVPSDGTLYLSRPLYLYGDASKITNPSRTNILDGAPADGLYYKGNRPRYMLVNDQESHKFTYTSNGNKITATCQISSCTLTAKPTLTLEAPKNLTYDGKYKPATTKIENDATGAFADVGITYTNGQDKACGVPKDADSYTAKVEVGGVSIAVGFTISKAANPMKAKAKSEVKKTFNASKAVVTAKNVTVTKAQGKVTYANVSANATAKRFVVNKDSGTVTVRKKTKVGKYAVKVKVTAAGNANYEARCWTVSYNIVVVKAKNPLYAKAVARSAKFADLEKGAVTVERPMKVTKNQGKLSYRKVNGPKKMTVNVRTGRVTVKQDTKKGTYTIGIKVTAKGNTNYKVGSKTVTCKVVVK